MLLLYEDHNPSGCFCPPVLKMAVSSRLRSFALFLSPIPLPSSKNFLLVSTPDICIRAYKTLHTISTELCHNLTLLCHDQVKIVRLSSRERFLLDESATAAR